MKKNALLIIDPQNSFCNPGRTHASARGSLYVQGADRDMETLAQWIRDNAAKIDYIGVTIDSHHPNDIAHPNFWQDKNGVFPAPFTVISSKEVEDGTWTPRFAPQKCLAYLKALEAQGEFPHVIWPVHCVIGSEGAAIYPPLMEAIEQWTKQGKFYETFTKGTFPFSEHFGAFQAQIPDPDRPETQFNQSLLRTLDNYQNVYLAGEARSHCVANSLKQVMNEAPEVARKFILLDNCMSNVTGFEHIADPIYDQARQMGIVFTATDKVKL